MSSVTAAREVPVAVRATYVAFIGAGAAMASWASRIPQIRDALSLSPSRLGLVLLAIAAGSLLALVASGQIVARLGSRRTVAVMAALMTAGLVTVAVGYRSGLVPVIAGLTVFGFANGGWDVAMNVQGAIVERRLGRAIMPRFHAGFSVGTVAGALAGAGAVALGLPVAPHLVLVAVLVGGAVILSVRGFVPDTTEPDPAAEGAAAGVGRAAADDGGGLRRTLATWREPRTLMVGVFVLAFAFAEGAGVDWISVAVIDDYGASATVGTLVFAVFLAAITAGRWFGPALLDRYGRVAVVRGLAAVSLAGLLLFVFGPAAPVAFAGALLWGLGTSLGFPVGMSAAADDPARAAARVSVVASIGYCAFLGGPPLIGVLGDHVTVQKALIAVAVLLAVSVAMAGSVRPLKAG